MQGSRHPQLGGMRLKIACRRVKEGRSAVVRLQQREGLRISAYPANQRHALHAQGNGRGGRTDAAATTAPDEKICVILPPS